MIEQETNKFIRFWIWFWYNDATRLMVLFGAHLLLTIPLLAYFGVPGETLRTIAAIQYGVVFALAVFDNDYSNLRRIGLNEYRRPLKNQN